MQARVLLSLLLVAVSADLGAYSARAQSIAPGVPASAGVSSTEESEANRQAIDDDLASRTAYDKPPDSEPSAKLGPALPEDIRLIGTSFPPNAFTQWASRHRLRFFGWMNGGYTQASTGEGLLSVEPRANRFGDSWMFNEAAFVLEKTLASEGWSWGSRVEFYMGGDAELLHPLDGFGPSQTPRFGYDFRQAYFSIHVPVLTARGVDIKLGRQDTPLGYDTTMAPYRPMYSQAYVWLYSQNGATTGAIATFHVDPRLDVIGGATLGVNSLFNFPSRAPSYIARAIYWLQDSKRTKLIGTYYSGPQPIAAASGHIGRWQTEVELQLIHDVNRRLTLVSETNFGWDTRDPANKLHTSQWHGTYGMGIVHVHRLLDVNTRAEWFDDHDGSRIGTRSTYGETSAGVNFMPTRVVNFRPEVRWDVASNPVFGPVGSSKLQSHQWTFAFDAMLKF